MGYACMCVCMYMDIEQIKQYMDTGQMSNRPTYAGVPGTLPCTPPPPPAGVATVVAVEAEPPSICE